MNHLSIYEGRQVSYTTLLSANVRGLRLAQHIHQSQMAEELAIDRSWYGKLERSRSTCWNVPYLVLAVDVLGTTLPDLTRLASNLEERVSPCVEVVAANRLDWSREPLSVDEITQLDRELRVLNSMKRGRRH